jgi:hypothetical protein
MKRMANMLDAGLPNPPTVVQFEGVLKNVVKPPEDNVDALLGDIPDARDEEKK